MGDLITVSSYTVDKLPPDLPPMVRLALGYGARLQRGTLDVRLPDGRTVTVAGLAESPRAAARPGTIVQFRDGENGRERGQWQTDIKSVAALAYAPDGRTLATRMNGAAWLWDAATDRPIGPLWHEGAVCAVAFSADGRTLATGEGDGTIRLWDTARGTLRRFHCQHAGGVQSFQQRPGPGQ